MVIGRAWLSGSRWLIFSRNAPRFFGCNSGDCSPALGFSPSGSARRAARVSLATGAAI